MNINSSNSQNDETEKVMEELKRILGASQDRRRAGGTWDESKRNNEKDGNVVPKPGEAK